MEPLRGVVQNYEWGMRSPDCQVASLGAANTGAVAEAGRPYAELWLGTHPSGPAQLPAAGGATLKAWLAEAPADRLGAAVAARWGGDLPFLLKVLSVATALSIQAHPDKVLAAKLFAERPDIYKDGNHKPEMALALTRFEALVGFVSPSELAAAFQRVPELATACGPEAASAVAAAAAAAPGSDAAVAALRSAFGALMSLDSAAAAAAVSLAAARLRGGSGSPGGSAPPKDARDALLLRLHEQYPGDVGVLAASMLNYVTLAPGEGVALAANEPHAYLSGECMECMATSDNVVRAGLTPKLRDVPTLAAMLTYSQGKPRVLAGEPAGVDGDVAWVRAYAPGFDEFELDAVALPEGRACALRPSAGAAVLLVTGGGGEAAVEGAAKESMAPGQAWLLPPGAKVKLHAHQGELRAFRARVADKALA